MSVIRCGACGIDLTRPVEPLADESVRCRGDGQSFIPAGKFWMSDGDYYPAGEWVANLADLINTRHHHNPRRLNGCCGLDGCDGYNRVCINGHGAGTERSDCRWAHGIHFSPALVYVADAEPGIAPNRADT